MSDIAVVGRFAGPSALGSVGSTTILVTLFTGFLIGMGHGVNVLIATHYGAKNHKGVEEIVHTSIILCFSIGLIVLILGILFSRNFLELLNTKSDLIDDATLYLRIYFLGMPALALYNFGNAVLSAVGDTKRPLYYLFAAGIINVLLNLFFVISCKMGVDGVAIASVIAQYISAILIIISLLVRHESYSLRFSSLRLHYDKALKVLSLGIPSGFQYAIFAIANLFIQTGVNTFSSTVVEGNAAAANADALVYDIMAAFYTACSSFIGQNYGAGKIDRIKKSYFISLIYSFGSGAIIGLLLVLFGNTFLSLFTTEAAVAKEGMIRLTVMGCSYAFSAFMDCSIAASRGLGKSLVPTIIVILGSCVFRVIWVYTVFAYFKTLLSLYLLYIFSWIITATAEIIYFIICYKKAIKSIQINQAL